MLAPQKGRGLFPATAGAPARHGLSPQRPRPDHRGAGLSTINYGVQLKFRLFTTVTAVGPFAGTVQRSLEPYADHATRSCSLNCALTASQLRRVGA